MACVYIYTILLTFVGPEYLRRSFEVRYDSDIAEAAGHQTIETALRRRGGSGMERMEGERNMGEKQDIRAVEKV